MKINNETHVIRKLALSQAIEVARIRSDSRKDQADMVLSDAKAFEAYLMGDEKE